MDSFKLGHASAERWQDAIESCIAQLGGLPSTANLGFLYATDFLAADMPEILTYLKYRTGVQHWVGTVGVGICSTAKEYFDVPALAIMLGAFPEDSFHVFNATSEEFEEFSRTHQSWCSSKQALFAIVHGDPRNQDINQLVVQLSEKLGEAFLVGGLTSSRTEFVQIADDITEGSLSGVMFSSAVPVTTRLTQGCSIIGARHQVTESDENILVKIDDRPALDVFREDIGEELANDLRKAAGYIFVALPILGSDTGDYLVRNLLGVDIQHKLLAISELVTPGMPILFARRDAETAHKELVKMLTHLKNNLTSTPKGGVYYSCLGRGKNLFGDDSQELKTIESILGTFPLVGFFANGEISHQRLYGYTGVLTLFL